MTNKEFLIDRIKVALNDYPGKDPELDYRLVLRALLEYLEDEGD